MVIQNSLEGKSDRKPKFRSLLSQMIFTSFSSGEATVWSDTKMVFNSPNLEEDPPFYRGIDQFFSDNVAPDWVVGALSMIDAHLPDRHVLLGAIDDFSLNIPSTPAAYRLPHEPAADEIAICIVSARALIKVSGELVRPLSMDETAMIDFLNYASELCVIIGGEEAISISLDIAEDARIYAHD